jgi:hypothetical protein
MVERGQGADAHELLGADFDLLEALGVVEVRGALVRHDRIPGGVEFGRNIEEGAGEGKGGEDVRLRRTNPSSGCRHLLPQGEKAMEPARHR